MQQRGERIDAILTEASGCKLPQNSTYGSITPSGFTGWKQMSMLAASAATTEATKSCGDRQSQRFRPSRIVIGAAPNFMLLGLYVNALKRWGRVERGWTWPSDR